MTIKHIRPEVLAMPDPVAAFSAVEAVAVRQGLPPEHIIKLDANENPYGPSPKVQAAMAAGQAWHLYPDITHQALNRALAAYAGVSPEQVVATSGCDELIAMLAQLLIGPGDEAIDNAPTFAIYSLVVHVQGGHMVVVPRLREQHYALDTPAILRALSERTRLIFVCNPNNPTGGLTPQRDIEALLETGIVVAVDETYHEFAGVTMAPLLQRYENLVVMRSMSKWSGLAGLRVGYGLFHPDLARQMRKLRMPFNVNLAGYVAALASLDDVAYLHANVAKMIAERERLLQLLQGIPFLHCYPSHANFVLCDVTGVPAGRLRDEMEKEGVLVRVYQSMYLPNAIRISVGKPQHTEAAIAALHTAGQRLKLL
jgi:histidinol-phosphate aminotransferase